MLNSLRHVSWVCSLALHILVLLAGVYLSTGTELKINLDKRVYQVDLVGPANKGKPGAKSAPKVASAQNVAAQKVVPKSVPAAPDVDKTPSKKAAPVEDVKKDLPADTAKKPIPQETVNATKEEPKKEEPKKEEPKPEPAKKNEPKKEDVAKKETPKKSEKPAASKSKEDILSEALSDAGKRATGIKDAKGSAADGVVKDGAKGSSKNALADALADIGREVSGRGHSGDGSSGDGDGEGAASGTLEEWYASQVIKAIRQNWRFPRLSNVVIAATVEIRVGPDGEIVASRLKNGSGRPDFDASVMRAIEDTKHLPRLPEGMSSSEIVITFYNTEN